VVVARWPTWRWRRRWLLGRSARPREYSSLQAVSSSGQPQEAERAARACMMKEMPSQRRLTFAPLISWALPK
jgi:hypothetical protein